MALLQYPLVNGVLYDYSTVKIKLRGKVYVGVTAVNFEDAITRGYLMGTAQKRLGKTPGQYEPTASLEMGLDEHFEFLRELGDAYANVQFQVQVQFTANGKTNTVDIVDCNIDKISDAHGASPDALKVTIDLSVMDIKRNGLSPVAAVTAQG